jgi:hypothetical protein
MVARPWQVRDRAMAMVFVESLSDELDESLLAMFVDETLALLPIETMSRGGFHRWQ